MREDTGLFFRTEVPSFGDWSMKVADRYSLPGSRGIENESYISFTRSSFGPSHLLG
jgi:hypothetical protein